MTVDLVKIDKGFIIKSDNLKMKKINTRDDNLILASDVSEYIQFCIGKANSIVTK